MNKNLAFFTAYGSGAKNERSRKVIEAILNLDEEIYRARVIKLGEWKPEVSATRIVTIYDADCVGSLWFPRLRTDANIPIWAANLSSGPVAGVCNSCCDACSAEKVAREIVRFFTKDLICGVNKADIVDEGLRETIFTGGDTRRRDFELRIYGSSRN